MKLSLVLIVYRSDSSTAQEASKFCEETLKAKNIKSNRIESDFQKDEIEKYLFNSQILTFTHKSKKNLLFLNKPWLITPLVVNLIKIKRKIP